MVDCLRAHRETLSEACRTEELKLNIVQARDMRLRPKLRKLCAQEIATHCSTVKPGAPSPTKLLRAPLEPYYDLELLRCS